MQKKPIVLIIMDGWGLAAPGPGNAVSLAQTPNFNHYQGAYPFTKLQASGEAVGLPRGDKGNSETGHLNLGAGRIVYQDLARINLAIANASFFARPAFSELLTYVKSHSGRLHLLGLIGAGGVHSSLEHLMALLTFAQQNSISQVYLHLFTDGRDSPPTSAGIYLAQVQAQLQKLQLGVLASLCGRYYAMDRDQHWERTELAYRLLTEGQGQTFSDYRQALQASYAASITDEFLKPVILEPTGLIRDGDAVMFFNFRIDRPRQLTKAFVLPNFEDPTTHKQTFDPYSEKYHSDPDSRKPFVRHTVLKDLFFATMTEYEAGLPVAAAFPPEIVQLPLSRVLSDHGLRQLHMAETEKERFVTYYFNGQREEREVGEDALIIPSPNVPTYDSQPQMSALELTHRLIQSLETNVYDFVLVNFANPDMVGHTGVLRSGITACEVVDQCVGKVVSTVQALGGTTIITADHGNVEEMINLTTGQVDTEHSANPVPFIVIDSDHKITALKNGLLADVAPTILELLTIPKPESMTGQSLLLA